MLGRIMGVVILASMGTFPVSVVLSGVPAEPQAPTPSPAQSTGSSAR